ncbi:MAG: cytidylyltransferase domain-containing protein [Desulfobacterales bacterium]
MDKKVVIVQARMGSTRLPGKMMIKLAGRPLIDYALERLCLALKPEGMLDAIVLATSTEANNDPLVEHVSKRWPKVNVVRGPEDDVLARFVSSIKKTGATVVVRATGDCPFINIDAMHRMVEELTRSGADVVNYRPGYEYVDKGLEVVSAQSLIRAAKDPSLTPIDREHVTSLMYRLPDRYSVHYIESAPFLRRGDIRLTVDTPEDLRFFEALIKILPADPCRISLDQIVAILDEHPEIKTINAASGRKSTLHEHARLGFRCDGNVEIGLGHVVGSIRLATLLARELGIGAEFVVRENHAAQSLINQAGFPMEVLAGDTQPEKDVERLIEKKTESDWSGVVINFCKEDLERYTPHFHSIKESGIPLIFMDNPLPPSYRLGDLLINALPHPDYEGYEPDQHPNCLDGLEYFIPGIEGPTPEKIIKPEIERVLIAMGGADKPNLTSLVIKGLSEAGFKGFADIVLGSACPHYGTVQKDIKDTGIDGSLHTNVSDLQQRMLQADLGFSGLGLTTYEMAYCRLPVGIISSSALNAVATEQYVQKYHAAEHLGFYEKIDPRQISSWFLKFSDDQDRRIALSNAGYRVVKKIDQVVSAVSRALDLQEILPG